MMKCNVEHDSDLEPKLRKVGHKKDHDGPDQRQPSETG